MKRLPVAILAVSFLLCALLPGVLYRSAVAAQETQQVGVVIQEMPYDSARKIYGLRFSVTNPERVGMVIVRVVDSNSTDVGKYLVELNMSRTAEVLIDGSGFRPGGEYTVLIQAQDPFGNLLRRPGDSSSGSLAEQLILDQREFTHREEAPKDFEFSVESANPDFVVGLLIIDLDVPPDVSVFSYDGFIVNESGQKLLEFGPQPFMGTRLQIQLPEAMSQGEGQQEYTLTVNLTTHENVRSRAKLEFKVTSPEPPGLSERIQAALAKSPSIAVAIIAVLGAASTLAILFSRRKRDPLYDEGRPPPVNPDTGILPPSQKIVRPMPVQRPVKSVGLRVRVVRTPGASQVPDSELQSFPITLGRENRDISFPGDPAVSRSHAQVTVRDGRIWLEDTGSTNGTFVGDVRLQKLVPVPLDRVTQVRLGSSTVIELEVGP